MGSLKMFDHGVSHCLMMQLPPQARLTFGLLCSERLYPNYVAFSREQGWGDPEALRAALDIAWNVLLGHIPSTDLLTQLKKAIQEAEPSTECFSTILVSPALDAAAATGLLLDFIETEDLDRLVEIETLCCDTIDMYLQATDLLNFPGENLDEAVHLHEKMQAELRRQRDDLDMLAAISWTPEEVCRLRDRWRDPVVGNLGF